MADIRWHYECNSTDGVVVYCRHHVRFCRPVRFGVLYDAERIDPQVFEAKVAGDPNGFGEDI